jgi:homoserine O-acetyltransferase
MRRFLIAFLFATSARGGDFIVKNFRFHDGETMAEVRIHYVTVGSPSGKAVLILHGTGGSSKQFLSDHFAGVLFKPAGLLDSSRFFIVIPDSVGHGVSSMPNDGLRRIFPHY